MTGWFWWDLLLGITAAVLLTWLALVIVLVIARPHGRLLREAVRVLPELLRLVRRLPPIGLCRAVFVFGWGCCWPTSRSRST